MMTGAHILATGSALPDKCINNYELSKVVDTSDEWIYTRTGIKERRLISKPIQILNQEEEEILIIVPKTREIKNSNLKEFFKI